MIKYALFDLDGTLTDSQVGIMKALEYSVKQYGLKLTKEQMRTMIGPPLDVTYKNTLGFTQEQSDKATSTFREYYNVTGLFENEPYKGIEEQLKLNQQQGIKNLLATSKPEETAQRILIHFGLDKYFSGMCGGSFDESRSKKSLVIEYALKTAGIFNEEKQYAIMIGDRRNDIEGAKANGLKSIGVLWGFGDREELENAGADYIITNTEELSPLLNSL